MQCREVGDAVRSDQSVPEADLERHLESCSGCAALVDASVEGLVPARPRIPYEAELGPLLREVEATLSMERGLGARLRSLRTPVRLALASAAVGLMALSLFVLARRVDFAVYPAWRLASLVAVYALLLGGALRHQLRPLHSVVRAAGHDVLWPTLGFVAPFVIALLPPQRLAQTVSTVGEGQNCLVIGIAFGGALIALLRGLDRTDHPDRGAVLLASAAAGLAANLVLELYCPLLHRAHLAAIHAPIGIVLLVLYMGIRRLWPSLLARRT